MAVILFPNQKEIARLCNSAFRGGVLCPNYLCNNISGEGRLSEIEEEVLSEIQETVFLVNKKIEDLIKKIPFPDIAQKYRFENSFTNWRDRSHFIRLCLGMLDKEVDEDVLSIMGLFEIFHLSWLIADEAIDETEKCEGKNTIYNQEGLISSLCISNIAHSVTTSVLQNIAKNKKLDVNTLLEIQAMLSRLWTNTWYGFYKDAKAFIEINNNIEIDFDVEELEYFQRIELIWSSYFEESIKVVLRLFSEVDPEKLKLFGKIGKLWGKMLKLRDDIVDLVGEREGLGREPCEDIIVKNDVIKIKKTLPLIRILRNLKEKNVNVKEIKEKIRKLKEDPKNNLGEFSDSINYSIKKLQSVAGEITELLMPLPDNDAKISMMKLISLVSVIKY